MLFGTSGIRGKYPSFVNESIGFNVGYVFDEFLIARDTRRTAIPVFNSVISGGLASGKQVFITENEIAPTPVLSFGAQYYNKKGIMITASHNPETDCGIKLFEEGKEISKDRENEIERLIQNIQEQNKTQTSNINFQNAKTSEQIDIISPYIEHILNTFDSMINNNEKSLHDCKVIVDTNGAASVVTPYILQKLGCNVITLNSDLFGFDRQSEPSKSHLSLISDLVKSEHADFGIAHDGDADRAVLIDDNGNVLPQDVQLLMVVDYILQKNPGNIISTVESSLSIEEMIKSHGKKLFMTPVGSTYISFKLEQTHAVFGGEPCGEYVFENNIHTPDGIFTAVSFVDMFLNYGKFSELRKKYTTYPILRDKFRVKDKIKTMDVLKQKISSEYEGKINSIDGIRIEEDGFWVLIRPSGTEDVIRLTVEAKSNQTLNSIYSKFKNLILAS